MRDFHLDKKRYFEFQYRTAKEYIIPYLKPDKALKSGDRVLEIGSAEAGVLRAFRELGCSCTGVELRPDRVRNALKFHEEYDLPGEIRFVNKNIYDVNPDNDLGGKFDLVILKDVIEHIPDQERFIPVLKSLLKPDGVIFFGFPPWRMPFGGHQQIARSKLLSVLPYYHLLPMGIYKAILKMFGEQDKRIEDLVEIKETRISINRFERIVKRTGYTILNRKAWLLNPIYKFKFGKGPIGQAGLVAAIPWFRDFVTTAMYYTIGVNESD